MWSSTIPFSCARFMMLSLNGAQQISGNSVTMSIVIEKETSNAQHPTSNAEIVETPRRLTQTPYNYSTISKPPVARGVRRNWRVLSDELQARKIFCNFIKQVISTRKGFLDLCHFFCNFGQQIPKYMVTT